MRFPKVLSRERLYLLSPEDREIYYKEHPRAAEPPKIKPVLREHYETDSDAVSGDEFDALLESEFREISESIDSSTVVDDFVDSFIAGEVAGIMEDFEEIFKELRPLFEEMGVELDEDRWNVAGEAWQMLAEEEYTLDDETNESLLLEGAEGYDCGEWIKGLMPKVGWLGKWIGAGLGALGIGLGYLITVGKDRLAMAKLKRYMNRLVELTDQGVHKKRPWYSYLTWGETRKNLGEYNTGCFRTIQETADRNMCICVMVAAQKLGFFRTGEMMSMPSGGYYQAGGGISAFADMVSKLNFTVH